MYAIGWGGDDICIIHDLVVLNNVVIVGADAGDVLDFDIISADDGELVSGNAERGVVVICCVVPGDYESFLAVAIGEDVGLDDYTAAGLHSFDVDDGRSCYWDACDSYVGEGVVADGYLIEIGGVCVYWRDCFDVYDVFAGDGDAGEGIAFNGDASDVAGYGSGGGGVCHGDDGGRCAALGNNVVLHDQLVDVASNILIGEDVEVASCSSEVAAGESVVENRDGSHVDDFDPGCKAGDAIFNRVVSDGGCIVSVVAGFFVLYLY